jgi:hypothetical protein
MKEFGTFLWRITSAHVVTWGAVTGVIVYSSLEKKYLINGDWKSFEEMKASLKY